MNRLSIVIALFVLAGLCEIGGGYMVWGWMRDNKSLLRGVVATLRPMPSFRRVHASYGGVLVVLAIVWSVVVDSFRPDRYDLLGALIVVRGVAVMVVPSRG